MFGATHTMYALEAGTIVDALQLDEVKRCLLEDLEVLGEVCPFVLNTQLEAVMQRVAEEGEPLDASNCSLVSPAVHELKPKRNASCPPQQRILNTIHIQPACAPR